MLITLKDMITKDYLVKKVVAYKEDETCFVANALDLNIAFISHGKSREDFDTQGEAAVSLYCPQEELKTEIIDTNLRDNINKKDYFIWRDTLYMPVDDNDIRRYSYHRDRYARISTTVVVVQVIGYKSYADFLQDNKTVIKDKFAIAGEIKNLKELL